MALTGMQIYKNLPKTNCKDCGLPTCMAFAMQVAAKQRSVTDCPHLSSEGNSALSEASAPPMKLVRIGAGDKIFELGQETVMFRHEEKFHRATGLGVVLPSSLSDADFASKIDKINKASFVRVGATLKVAFAAVELDGAADPAARAKTAAEKSSVPIILMGKNPDSMKKAADAIKAARPLIYYADKSNLDAFAAMAAEMKLPLAVHGENLEELETMSQQAKDKGVEDIILAFKGGKHADTIRNLTIARRAALKKQFRPFGFPSMMECEEQNPEMETIMGAVYAAKYCGIVLIRGMEPWELLPIMTTVQDVYTDPQVPNTVEVKLYEIGSPTENSPVLFTTNFSLTYFSVEGEVERSKVPAFICVVDTEGLGVLNAYAGDKISAEKVVKALAAQKVAERVKHRKLIIPGLLPIFRAEIEDTSEWKEVIIGPENAREIPAFLVKNWS
ncbi:MAG: acetyl-CoA decarbonylase/synthase complex subunit gamma [Spirochaetales bacterium]|nr:MAG: acetyl-CoA decarbonylase/synthase complex subunit gamma [Spirochaetales bacterium]